MSRKSLQREAILRFLRKTRAHPTADEVYEEVKKEIPRISKGTVYRNLSFLQLNGLVSELNLAGTTSRFESRRKAHYHFRCERCGGVFDLAEPVNKDMDERVAQSTGFTVSYHYLEFRGLCRGCQV